MELLLRPKREAFSQRRRHAQYQAQGGRCALCDAELRTGEDEGDHVQPLHSTVAGQPQTFRLLCVSCHQVISDPAARREAGILQSHFNLATAAFRDSPKPVPATFVTETLDLSLFFYFQ